MQPTVQCWVACDSPNGSLSFMLSTPHSRKTLLADYPPPSFSQGAPTPEMDLKSQWNWCKLLRPPAWGRRGGIRPFSQGLLGKDAEGGREKNGSCQSCRGRGRCAFFFSFVKGFYLLYLKGRVTREGGRKREISSAGSFPNDCNSQAKARSFSQVSTWCLSNCPSSRALSRCVSREPSQRGAARLAWARGTPALQMAAFPARSQHWPHSSFWMVNLHRQPFLITRQVAGGSC